MKPLQVVYLCVLVLCISILTNASIPRSPEDNDEIEVFIEKSVVEQNTSESLEVEEDSLDLLNVKEAAAGDSWDYFHKKSERPQKEDFSDQKNYEGIYK